MKTEGSVEREKINKEEFYKEYFRTYGSKQTKGINGNVNKKRIKKEEEVKKEGNSPINRGNKYPSYATLNVYFIS